MSRELDSIYIKSIYSQKCDCDWMCQSRSTSRSLSTKQTFFFVIQTNQTPSSVYMIVFYSWDRKILYLITLMAVLLCLLHVCVCVYLTSIAMNKATAVTPLSRWPSWLLVSLVMPWSHTHIHTQSPSWWINYCLQMHSGKILQLLKVCLIDCENTTSTLSYTHGSNVLTHAAC